MPYERTDGDFFVTTDASRIDNDVVESFLQQTYWAAQRSRDRIDRSMRNSLCFGLFEKEQLIGFSRVVTDYADFAWLCDVFILEEYRGRSLGTWLLATVLAHPELQGLRRWILATSTAQKLYSQFGFVPLAKPSIWMEYTP
ncbi:MAG: GNAT family N-acetyltransferase [Candidatus Eremiobacteraeota bacterium]|nr:GNAT family N-acetyltransferase [Candidatus Eremiobacteraeota bacterium]